jgi:predicted AlkP superfamily pyrophosphatase or phosphodiesterase
VTPPVLCILVDAFRHDYLDERRTPVLARLATDLGSARIRPILGYSDSIRATIFTGRYPSEHGYWMEYCYRPEARAFGRLDRLAPLDAVPSDFVQRCLKLALSKTIVRRLARRNGYRDLSLRHLPFRSLGRFDWTLRTRMTERRALGAETIFDELSGEGVGWSYLDSSRGGRRIVLQELDRLPRDTRFTFVYLHHVDMASHVVGLESRLFERVLRKTDALVGEVLERFRARLGEPDLLVFSDHGMSAINRLVSFRDLVRHPGFPRRFCFALDATMVRLWYEDDDPELRAEVRQRIAARARGRFLGQDELRELHLDFEHRLYGDEIFLLEPGQAIFPNFHSMLRPRAMHAYHPDDPEQHGIFIGLAGAEREAVELVEIAPLCRRLLGLGQPLEHVAVAAACG